MREKFTQSLTRWLSSGISLKALQSKSFVKVRYIATSGIKGLLRLGRGWRLGSHPLCISREENSHKYLSKQWLACSDYMQMSSPRPGGHTRVSVCRVRYGERKRPRVLSKTAGAKRVKAGVNFLFKSCEELHLSFVCWFLKPRFSVAWWKFVFPLRSAASDGKLWNAPPRESRHVPRGSVRNYCFLKDFLCWFPKTSLKYYEPWRSKKPRVGRDNYEFFPGL